MSPEIDDEEIPSLGDIEEVFVFLAIVVLFVDRSLTRWRLCETQLHMIGEMYLI